MKKVGLFGGSFDPIHCGHIRPVLEAQKQLNLDRVVFLPTGRPPHKSDRSLAPAHSRFAMVEIALLEHPHLVASPLELDVSRPAYTIDSVEHFRERFPDAEIDLLMGGDSFVALESWRRWRDLVSICRLAVLRRPGWEPGRVRSESSSELAALVSGGRVAFIDNAPEQISSTRLRALLATQEAVPEDWLPPPVVDYVRKYSLYS